MYGNINKARRFKIKTKKVLDIFDSIWDNCTIMNCQICNKHEAECKDYRFIDSCGLQGKVYSCKWCTSLNDDAICEVVGEKLDPKEFYDTDSKEGFPTGNDVDFGTSME